MAISRVLPVAWFRPQGRTAHASAVIAWRLVQHWLQPASAEVFEPPFANVLYRCGTQVRELLGGNLPGLVANSKLIAWLTPTSSGQPPNPVSWAQFAQSTATLLFGSDSTYTDCASYQLNSIGFNDVVNCVAKEKGATPVDAYTPF